MIHLCPGDEQREVKKNERECNSEPYRKIDEAYIRLQGETYGGNVILDSLQYQVVVALYRDMSSSTENKTLQIA